jgi:hypothetical protein
VAKPILEQLLPDVRSFAITAAMCGFTLRMVTVEGRQSPVGDYPRWLFASQCNWLVCVARTLV